MAVQRQAVTSAVIESGRVLDVDVQTYSLTVTTQYTKKPQAGISFATPYQHFANGEGIYFMPEVGSLCWICFPSDGSRPFVIAWAPARDEDGFRSKKLALNPGDIYLGTRDENFVVLRRGGVVQIGGGPLCQRIFMPINNAIKDFCENYFLRTLGGDLEWTIARDENTVDGRRPASLRIRAREFADDQEPIASLEIGSHDGDPQSILSLGINESGKYGAAKKISLKMSKTGKVVWEVEDDISIITKQNYLAYAAKSASMVAGEKALVEGKEVLIEAVGEDVSVRAAKDVNIAAGGQVNVEPLLYVAKGEIPVMLATPAILTYLLTHTHDFIGIAPGSSGVTLAPSVGMYPTDNAHVSKSIFAK